MHQFVDDRVLVERGLSNYWGYNSIGFFAPHHAYATRSVGQQVYEFKSMVKTLHRAGIEVILDVVYNHTARGEPPRPDAVAPGHRQQGLLPALTRGPPLLHRLLGHRQQPQHAAPAGDPADHGQPPVLGARDARRRLPLRPGARARARALRGEPTGNVLRHHPAGPGALAGEAHRRAVGRRARRLPGGQLPGRAGPNGTASTATASDGSGEAIPASSRSSPSGCPARATCTRRAAGTPTPRSTSSPPTTASRCRTS